ncbi:MAG: methyltransferase domain-containing protein [Anaerolineae bacterium]|nr:methyltransferase domain-containing protein [Anaerolineae bacterium]
MQGYGFDFARIYDMRWTHFAQNLAPRIHTFYEAHAPDEAPKRVLDLACGTGQLATLFLESGYAVIGLDLSPAMLAYAEENNHDAVAEGRADFVEGDAAGFDFDERFGLVVSTFDALNHLPDFDDLEGCFASTAAVLAPGGWFIFDLNTRFGLRRWGGIGVQEEEDLVLITRGVVSEAEGRAYTQISGFLRQADGRYERFGEVVYNTIFALDEVAEALADYGFAHVHFAAPEDLDAPLAEPETHSRVVVLAQKTEG